MASAGDEQSDAVFESRFDPLAGPVSMRVVEAVATFYEVEPTDLDPLYSAIDPDTLDALFDPTRTGSSSGGVVTFQYENLAVSVNGDGTIRLGEPE